MQKKRLASHLATVRAVAASKSVGTYYIGFTSRDPFKYFAWYRKRGYDHAVILADWLTEVEAKHLEQFLQEGVFGADKRSAVWAKAHENLKKCRYYAGAKSGRPKDSIHAVYMAWQNS